MASMTEFITPKRQAETRAAVERIGAFAVAARPEHLATDIRQLFKRNILDSIGCAIAAVAGPLSRGPSFGVQPAVKSKFLNRQREWACQIAGEIDEALVRPTAHDF